MGLKSFAATFLSLPLTFQALLRTSGIAPDATEMNEHELEPTDENIFDDEPALPAGDEWPGKIIGLPRPTTLKPHEKFGFAARFAESWVRETATDPKLRKEHIAAKSALQTLREAIKYQTVAKAPVETGTKAS